MTTECARSKCILGLALIAGVSMVWAATGELPPEVLDPKVTIEDYANRTEETYWLNNRKAAVKVTPKYGAPYYLVDPDGDSEYEVRRAGTDIDVKPNYWKLIEW